MSSNANPLPRKFVLPYCLRLWDRISPTCTQSSYAGSMRRFAETVSDIEIVAQPAEGGSFLPLLDSMVASGFLEWDEVTRRRGDLYKRFVLPALALDDSPGMAVDLFIANADNYGYILMLRTGCAEFSHAMVTPVSKGGLRPAHLRCKDGMVWQQNGDGQAVALSMPTEKALFAAWGLPCVAPADRTPEQVHVMRRAMGLPYISITRAKSDPVPTAPAHDRLEAFA